MALSHQQLSLRFVLRVAKNCASYKLILAIRALERTTSMHAGGQQVSRFLHPAYYRTKQTQMAA
jgi:hypothetical protein